MAEDRLNEQLKIMMEKAERSLHAAQSLLENGNFDFSSSRSYYSAFYTIQALLLTKNYVYSKHSGVIAGFSEHFIRKEIFPARFAKYISRLFRERHIGDYDYTSIISREDAEKDYKIAMEIVSAVKKYLIEQGFAGNN
mgnify:CR=1 FL=1